MWSCIAHGGDGEWRRRFTLLSEDGLYDVGYYYGDKDDEVLH